MVNRYTVTALILIFVGLFFSKLTSGERQPLLLKPQYENLTYEAKRQVRCLTENIYHEARNEPEQGKIAVAFVTINRVNSGDFPNTICDVVEQKTRVSLIGDSRIVCQFSWYCESIPKQIYVNQHLTNSNDEVYKRIRDIALYVYANHDKIEDPTLGSLFYHANYVSPNWKNLQKVTQIGAHIFYTKRETT